MIKKIIDIHYSAMKFKQRGIPPQWSSRMANVFGIHLIFILGSIVFNIAFVFELKDKFFIYLFTGLIVLFVYKNTKYIEKFILKYEPQKRYKETKTIYNFINILLMIFIFLITFFCFIFSLYFLSFIIRIIN